MPNLKKLPSIQEIFLDLIVAIIIYEILHFYIHWALHSKLVYEKIHKRHYEWKAPVAVSAYYAHPLDHILCNLIPIICGVLRCHVISVFIWFTIILIYNQLIHCGYHLPFLPSPETHSYHHTQWGNIHRRIGWFETLLFYFYFGFHNVFEPVIIR
jgi:methylsterol monooxygenase